MKHEAVREMAISALREIADIVARENHISIDAAYDIAVRETRLLLGVPSKPVSRGKCSLCKCERHKSGVVRERKIAYEG